jgi:hypothetical protein
MTKNKTEHREIRTRTPATGWTRKTEIEALLARGVPMPTEVVTHLRWQDIEVAESVFQWRDRKCDPQDKARHIGVLVRALSIRGEPFNALSVFPAGGRYFLIDGHHRLAAYEAADWKDPIPVKVFEGSLEQARIAALESNHEDKLPLARVEKSNGAWRLVAEGFDLSIQRTAVLGQVSVTTVKTMRNQLRRITEAGEDPLWMDWERARQWPDGSPYDPDEPESWCELKVKELAERILKSGLATEMGKHPVLFVEALRQINPAFPCAVAEQLETDALNEILEARVEPRETPEFGEIDAAKMADF